MITTYRTVAGDMLDAVCRRHYGTESTLVAVIEANPGLEAQPLRLPAGLAIVLPELSAAAAPSTSSAPVRLWGAA